MSIIHGEPLIYYINSDNRTNINDISSAFSMKIEMPVNHNYDHMCLLNASIPKSYYMIEKGYNTFYIQELGISYLVSLNIGNYSKNIWLTEIARALNAATSHNALWVYTVGFNNIIGKIIYSVSGNTGQPAIITNSNVYEQLGLSKNATTPFIANTLISTNVMKLQLEDCLKIVCGGVSSSIANNSGILQDVLVNTQDYSAITFQQYSIDLNSRRLQPTKNNVFRFSICNENLRVIDLNGLNVNYTVLFYKKDDTSLIQKEYIKIKTLEKLNNNDQSQN